MPLTGAWRGPQGNAGGEASDITGPVRVSVAEESAPAYSFDGRTGDGMYSYAANALAWSVNGNAEMVLGTVGFAVSSGHRIGWSSTADPGASGDLFLYRDAANTLAQKNSTNAQTFRVYGNTTGSHYLSLAHDGTDGVITVNGGGILKLGVTHTSIGSETVTGYITIKDSAGTSRKVAVVS